MNRRIAMFAAAIVVASAIASTCPAFDASPPPNPVTVEWTQEFLSKTKREITFEGTTVRQIVEFASSTMSFPGFYIDIDFDKVEDRMDRPLEINLKEYNWLQVLGRVADTIEADLIIGRGVIRFVPRDSRKGSWEKRFEYQKQQKQKPSEGNPFE